MQYYIHSTVCTVLAQNIELHSVNPLDTSLFNPLETGDCAVASELLETIKAMFPVILHG